MSMNYFRPVLVASTLVLALASARALAQDSLAGDWEITVNMPQQSPTFNLSLKQDGEKLTGGLTSPIGAVPVSGTVTGGAVALTALIELQGTRLQVGLDGKVAGETLSGTLRFGDFGEFPFTGKRADKSAPSAAGSAPVPAPSPALSSGDGGRVFGAAGKWNVVLSIPGAGEFPASATLTQEGDKVAGVLSSLGGEVPVTGTITGTVLKLEFMAKTPLGEVPIVLTGDLSEKGLIGKASVAGLSQADWTATRVP
jgi:hypothetical protein